MAVQSKEENKLIAGLPADYEVVQADDQFWLLAFLEVPTGESFTWRYLIEDPLEILEKIPGNITLTPNTVVSNGEVVEMKKTFKPKKYAKNHTLLLKTCLKMPNLKACQ